MRVIDKSMDFSQLGVDTFGSGALLFLVIREIRGMLRESRDKSPKNTMSIVDADRRRPSSAGEESTEYWRVTFAQIMAEQVRHLADSQSRRLDQLVETNQNIYRVMSEHTRILEELVDTSRRGVNGN